ncbi:Carboxy-terminal kinesin 2 [Nymphon striatum]|nr:Carboxy-terminal kinesin 2 [Nymphon striatum]
MKRTHSLDSPEMTLKPPSTVSAPVSKRQKLEKPGLKVSSSKYVGSLSAKQNISSFQKTQKSTLSVDKTNKSLHSASLSSQKATTKSKRAPWDVKGRLLDMEANFKNSQNFNANVQSQLAVSSQRISILEQNKQEIETDLKVQNNLNVVASEAVSELQNKLRLKEEEWERTKQNLNSEIEVLNNSESSLKRQVKLLQSDLDVSSAECSGLKIAISQQSSAQAGLTAELTAIKLQLNNAIQDSSLKSDRISSLEKSLEDKNRVNEELDQKLRDEEGNRRKLHNTIQELKGNIRVFCRVRPLLEHEVTSDASGGSDLLPHMSFPDPEKHTISLNKCSEVSLNESTMSGRAKGAIKHDFNFDRVFEPSSTQQEVFSEISQLVQSALDGYNVCVFAYGQTGSGKTFTMEGPSSIQSESDVGMIPRAVQQIFQTAQSLKPKGWEYSIQISYLEIYNETIRDLLSASNELKHEIKMRNGKKNDVYVTNLTSETVDKVTQVYKLIEKARKNRAIGATKCNHNSSRSHSVFQLKLMGNNSITTESCEGTLNLIDLAGSERLKDSGSEGDRLTETKSINSSLSVLGNVIMSLSNKADHIPYRNSKLTHLLMNSLGGNSKTLMFLNVSPREENFGESLNSLRFATKVNQCNIGTAQKKLKMYMNIKGKLDLRSEHIYKI